MEICPEGRKQQKWWAQLLPVGAPMPHQSELQFQQMYKRVVESEASDNYGRSVYNRSLQLLLTNSMRSHRPHRYSGHCCLSDVGAWFQIVPPHMQWPHQLLNLQKALTSYITWTTRQQMSNFDTLRFRRHYIGNSLNFLHTAYYGLSFLSINQLERGRYRTKFRNGNHSITSASSCTLSRELMNDK
jgi:hypothetical protein